MPSTGWKRSSGKQKKGNRLNQVNPCQIQSSNYVQIPDLTDPRQMNFENLGFDIGHGFEPWGPVPCPAEAEGTQNITSFSGSPGGRSGRGASHLIVDIA